MQPSVGLKMWGCAARTKISWTASWAQLHKGTIEPDCTTLWSLHKGIPRQIGPSKFWLLLPRTPSVYVASVLRHVSNCMIKCKVCLRATREKVLCSYSNCFSPFASNLCFMCVTVVLCLSLSKCKLITSSCHHKAASSRSVNECRTASNLISISVYPLAKISPIV